MTLKGVVNLFEWAGSEVPVTDPIVTLATTPADDKVRVYFDQAMRATNPGNVDDALNPDNYNITTGVGVPRSVVSVSLVSSNPMIVELTLDGEMTDGVAYTVEVSNVRSVFNIPLNPTFASANFTGQGTTPTLSSVTATSYSAIVVVFDEPMRDNPALVAPGNYSIGGYATVVVTNVTRNSPTQVTLTVQSTMKSGETYNLTVSNVQDIAWNPIASPGNIKSFTGVGNHPQVLYNAIPIDAYHVRIQFTKDVVGLEATDPDNYSINGGALAIVAVTQETSDTFLINTAQQTSGLAYAITVLEPGSPPPPDGVHDFYGNEVLAPNNVSVFLGMGISPPVVEILPGNDEHDVAVRTPLRVHCYDVEHEFSGIDITSIWVKLTYEDGDGTTQSFYAVKDGDIRPQCGGSRTGDPLSPAGVVYSLLPRFGRWAANTTYTIQAYAADIEGSTNLIQQTFRTGDVVCFEDLGGTPDTVDTQIAQALPYENLERLRDVLMRTSTSSVDQTVQARTVLYLAAMTDLRTVLARYVDFALVDNVRLCDRRPVLDVHAALMRYAASIPLALKELPGLSTEARKLLEKYTQNNSSVYVVNAVAVAVVLAAMKQGS